MSSQTKVFTAINMQLHLAMPTTQHQVSILATSSSDFRPAAQPKSSNPTVALQYRSAWQWVGRNPQVSHMNRLEFS